MRSIADPFKPDNNPDNLTKSADPSRDSVLSVSSLNKLARSLLESNFPAVAVEGEISNLVVPASGHMYLTLKDKNAQIRCAMFRNRNQMLRFRPKDGMQVVVRGRLSIYEGRGDYQLIADAMEEAGDGALRRAFEELKAKLNAEGLFDEAHKQEVHDGFRHIGIITSRTGAAIRDMVSVFGRRFPSTRLTLFPVAVQGADAASSIVAAIALANRLKDKLRLEALIVGRGGGSLEDLQAFNEEVVARAIFGSELPVTSAVGHEIDFTIADFVADLRAPTPSAAAELMSPDIGDTIQHLDSCALELRQRVSGRIAEAQKDLNWLRRQLKRPDRRLQDHAQTLDRLENQLQRGIRNVVSTRLAELLQRHRALVASSPSNRLLNTRQKLQGLSKQLHQGTSNILQRRNGRLGELARSLNAVSPLQVLARGYSITATESGQILRSIRTINAGDRIVSTLADGKVTATVEKTEGNSG